MPPNFNCHLSLDVITKVWELKKNDRTKELGEIKDESMG